MTKMQSGYYVLYFVVFQLVGSCTNKNGSDKNVQDNTKYVNVFIGTGGHGYTFPGATTPYGMVQLSSDTRTLGWDACGGYHYSDNSIIGFSHTHLSGTGIGDPGDILFMPFSGKPQINLEIEIKGWDFDVVRHSAKKHWAKELNQIQTEGGSPDEKNIFYTSLYHTAICPLTFSDADGRYPGMDQEIHQAGGKVIYTVYSLWDAFRASHPLKTIVDPERDNEFIVTLLTKYDQGGSLPMWELVANYTGCMIGYHAVPVIVDAHKKGIRNYNVEKAYNATLMSAEYDTTGILFPSRDVREKLVSKGKSYNEIMGFIPSGLKNELYF
jgi:putative alpha-1,2-mannosidase